VPEVKLRESSVISTLAKGTSLTGNTACEIFVSDDGRFVYTCTRGVDEIVVYRINQQSGLLTEHQRLSAGGKTPRYIALDPSRKWLVCCNQGAGKDPVGNVTVFAHDTATGKLSEKPKVFAAETPMFTLFV
jgi:6-phosphogluconolactonase